MARLSRRTFMAGTAAAIGAAAFPMPSIALATPMKVGVLTVKTGPLAAGGVHLEEGITAYLKDKNFTLSGRKIELVVADSGGNPAGAKTKAQELIERDKVNVILGPLAAYATAQKSDLAGLAERGPIGLFLVWLLVVGSFAVVLGRRLGRPAAMTVLPAGSKP